MELRAGGTDSAPAGAEGAPGGDESLEGWLDCRHFQTIDSTQSYVEREYASFDQSKLTAVSADFQTAGRGTNNRQWVSPEAQSVLITFYFRFPQELDTPFVNQNAPNVTQVLAVAAVDVLRSAAAGGAGLSFGVKWPNDVVVGGRKIGGVLARAQVFNQRLEGVIVGIGINVNTPQAELDLIDRPVWPATSLRAVTGDARTYDVGAVRLQLVRAFASSLRRFFASGFAAIRERFNSLEVLVGTRVSFRITETDVLSGVFEGVDGNGHIMLRLGSGELRVFPSGEIVPRPSGL
mmetsp:Transcript_30288/g.85428  ORF Transcript_30288/g.85428 Transcript_30288/m.85428 type:complete len:292 (-) Transcript_30288:134-1009(-)